MNRSLLFTQAHAAARLADVAVAYVVRFGQALKNAYQSLKQTITTTMSTILATVEKENIGFTETYDIFHVGQQAATGNGPFDRPAVTTAFVLSRPLDEQDVARFFFLTSHPTSRAGQPFTTYNGVALYRQDDVRLAGLDNERTQQAYGFTAADVEAFKKAANL